ncbi:MAG: UDP-glucose 4-epimerase GalE [Pseudomonadota bacterium]|nr:UDP-glucose 4-epimerase GalE [Pseudomonadota bacterium]
MRFLLTGGAGYIGTQILVELLQAGHDVAVIDNLSSGHLEALQRAQALAGRTFSFFRGDIADRELVSRALCGVDVVFHLAAYKLSGESMLRPERYFQNNVGGMCALLSAMEAAGVRRIVYSSSAAVYGAQREMPVHEDAPLRPESPYGASKAQGEQMLEWMVRCHQWSAVSLRYFNPVGAHASGHIGEPLESAASLVPRALYALTREDSRLTIMGTDYPTPDGTCLRDYVHVKDLARAHLLALGALEEPRHAIFNVGTGRPYSVREVLSACARVTGREVRFSEGARRPGDVPCAAANPGRFQRKVGFEAQLGLDEMVASAWNWCQLNPFGYQEAPGNVDGLALSGILPAEAQRAGAPPGPV